MSMNGGCFILTVISLALGHIICENFVNIQSHDRFIIRSYVQELSLMNVYWIKLTWGVINYVDTGFFLIWVRPWLNAQGGGFVMVFNDLGDIVPIIYVLGYWFGVYL